MVMEGGSSEELLEGDVLDNLPRRSVRGGAAVLIAQGGVLVLGLVSAAVLARLLSPDDYGLIGMAAAFIAFITNFADLGLPLATVQRERISDAGPGTSTTGLRTTRTRLTWRGGPRVASSRKPLQAWSIGCPSLSRCL